MKYNEIKNINLLGHKRNKTNQTSNYELKIFEEANSKHNNIKILSSKKSKFNKKLLEEENGINLEEKKENRIDNYINIVKNFCHKCNSRDNVICFNSLKSILDYLSKKKISLFKNFDLDENLNFDSPKIICLNCLLIISKNKTEFEKFIESNRHKNIMNDTDNPFLGLFENPNLKLFNDIDIKEKKAKNQIELNEKSESIFKKIYKQEPKRPLLINNVPNNNIINNPNINFDFYNIINYYPLSSINHNMPYNENMPNFNIQNYYINDKNQQIKNNIIYQNNQLCHPINSRPYIPYNQFSNDQEGIFTQNNTNILYLNNYPKLNKNYSKEKNIIIENGRNEMININIKNDKKNISKDNNENIKQNNIWKSFSINKNKLAEI